MGRSTRRGLIARAASARPASADVLRAESRTASDLMSPAPIRDRVLRAVVRCPSCATWGGRLDTVAEAMDAARSVALEASSQDLAGTQARHGHRGAPESMKGNGLWLCASADQRPFCRGDPDGTRTRGLRRDRAAR